MGMINPESEATAWEGEQQGSGCDLVVLMSTDRKSLQQAHVGSAGPVWWKPGVQGAVLVHRHCVSGLFFHFWIIR